MASFKESFKRSRRRGINVTCGSFASYRRSQDSAVAGIQVKRGTDSVLKYSSTSMYPNESGENISKSGVYATNQEINFRVYTSCV